MTISFEGQVAIVTGAGGGLGKQHALELAKFGEHRLACLGLLELLVGLDVEAGHGPVDAVQVDVVEAEPLERGRQRGLHRLQILPRRIQRIFDLDHHGVYVVFGLTSRYWNSWRFNRQVEGIDIRKLDRHQFTQHGRLIDKSFQMPREFQCMSAD